MHLHGYDVPSGYMGRVFGQYMLFPTEQEFREYYKEKRSITRRRTSNNGGSKSYRHPKPNH